MALFYNGVEIDSLNYNSEPIDTCSYNGQEVFMANKSVVLVESVKIKTDVSQVPPPYDSNGYNFNGTAPVMTEYHSIPLGDVTDYTRVEFKWNSSDSINAYGNLSGKVKLSTESEYHVLFTEDDKSGYYDIDLTELTGEIYLQFELSAQSKSSYRGYISLSGMLIQNVTIYKGSKKPTPEKEEVLLLSSMTLEAGSQSDGTHDAPLKTDQYQVPLGKASLYSKLIFDWSNTGTNVPYGSVTGSYYLSVNGQAQNRKFLYTNMSPVSARETINVSSISGDVVLIFEVSAKSESSNPSWLARSVLNIKDVKLQK